MVAALAQNYQALVSVEVVEAMAIPLRIQFATDLGIGPIGIESDASSMVSVINSKDIHRSDVCLVISDIIHLVHSFYVKHVEIVPRKCNVVAHGLARFSLTVDKPMHWLEDSPPCVEALVSAESSH
ncbi:hypothetical protein ACOSQ3_004802 [Xanthoceras sorbifolium]